MMPKMERHVVYVANCDGCGRSPYWDFVGDGPDWAKTPKEAVQQTLDDVKARTYLGGAVLLCWPCIKKLEN